MPDLQLVADLPGHTDPAWSVAWNPKRNLLASCSTDKSVRLYSYTLPSSSPSGSSPDGLPSRDSPKGSFSLSASVSTEHKRTIRSVSWAPSGRTFATGSFDSSVGIWEEVDPDEIEDEDGLEEGIERAAHVHGAGCSHGHQNGDEDMDDDHHHEGGSGRSKEWECVTMLEGHESECKSVEWSYDGGLLASCSRDKSVWVWEDNDFECIAVLMEHTQDVKTLAWHPREEILASASYDGHIHLLWDDPSGDWCAFQKLHPKLPAAPLSIPNSATSVVAALRPTPEESKAAEELSVPPLIEDETVWSLAWSPDGKYLASGGDLGGIRIWERTGHNPDSPLREVLHTAAHSRSVFALSWGPPAPGIEGLGYLASAGGDCKIIVWELSVLSSQSKGESEAGPNGDGAEQKSDQISVRPVAAVRDAHGVSDINSIAWSAREDGRGRGMLASCGDDGSVKVWRVVSD